MSAVSTERMAELRSALSHDMKALFCSNYSGDAHPSILFTGVKMRLTIVIGEREKSSTDGACLSTTGFLRWYAEARPHLFESVRYIQLPEIALLGGLIPKIASAVDLQVLDKLRLQRSQLEHFVIKESPHSVYAHRIVAHFVKCFDFVPYFRNDRDGVKRSEDYKVFSFRNGEQALLASAVLNSTLFYYFYLTYSDAYHCGRELILQFPCDLSSIKKELSRRLIGLNEKLMDDLRTHSVRRRIRYHGTGWIEYDEFYPRLSKSLIDEIDRALAAHYGLTEEEIDFVLHYDLKYRMGEELEEAED